MLVCILEFRGSGRARYMVRQRDLTDDRVPLADTDVWSDYDGDVIYGDYTVDEETGAVTALASYLPGVGQVDEATGTVYYDHADHLGSVRVVTSGGGLVRERIVHTAFGEPVTRLGIALTPTRYLYAGAWGYESDLGADHAGGSPGDDALPYQHLGFRWYNPASGRFLQRDPIGIAGGLSVYDYVFSCSTSFADPHGLAFIDFITGRVARYVLRNISPSFGICVSLAYSATSAGIAVSNTVNEVSQSRHRVVAPPILKDPRDVLSNDTRAAHHLVEAGRRSLLVADRNIQGGN